MDGLVDVILHQTEHLVVSTTDALFDSFSRFKGGSYTLPILLPAFLILALLGIQKKGSCAILVLLVLLPSYVDKALAVSKALAESDSPRLAKALFDVCVYMMNEVQNNIPPVMALVCIFMYIVRHRVKHCDALFYALILTSYYFSEIFDPTFRAYFDILAFLRTLAILPLIICVIYFEVLNDLVASLLYAFSGIWGLLHLAMRQSDSHDGKLFSGILKDLLHPNHETISIITIYFCMVLALSVFTQFALKTACDTKTALEDAKVAGKTKNHPH